MTNVLNVAFDLVREARHRHWLVALLGAVTLIVALLALALEVSVVDGVIAGTKLFGGMLSDTMQTTERAFEPVYKVMAWATYVCGLGFGILACADFAPNLLEPGRIEHLLSLPLRRWQLVLGTYVGVLLLASLTTVYGIALFTVLLGFKSGVWSAALVGAGLAGWVAFCAIYGAMLACAVFARSAAMSAAVGGCLWLCGSLLTTAEVAAMFDAGWKRETFVWSIGFLPSFSALGHMGPALAGYEALDADLARVVTSALVFGLACVCIAVWQLERKDY